MSTARCVHGPNTDNLHFGLHSLKVWKHFFSGTRNSFSEFNADWFSGSQPALIRLTVFRGHRAVAGLFGPWPHQPMCIGRPPIYTEFAGVVAPIYTTVASEGVTPVWTPRSVNRRADTEMNCGGVRAVKLTRCEERYRPLQR